MNTVLEAAPRKAVEFGQNEHPAWQSCLDGSDVFFKALEFGRIRGIAMIACNSASEGELIPLAQELTKRDILVVIAGEAAADVEKAERQDSSMFEQADTGLLDLCEFIGIKPVIYMDSCENCSSMLEFYKQLADLSGKEVSDLPLTAMAMPSGLTSLATLESMYGTVFGIMEDALKNADLLEEAIHEKRQELEWHDRLYCTEVGYS